MGDFPEAAEPVLVSDAPAKSTSTKVAAPDSTSPTDSPRTPYQSSGTTTTHHTKDGEYDGVTFTSIAKRDSTNYGINLAKGDAFIEVFDAEGKTIYFKVSHTVGQKTTVDEYSINPDTGETVRSTSEWAGGSLVQQDQYNVDAHRMGDRYIRDGEVYIRSTDQDGKTQWLNERNQTEQEWRLDPTNPLGVNAVNGSDLQSDQYRPPENANGNGTATKIAYQTVERDGNTYEVTANGTYDRAVSGHPGWTESRDSTGGGVILDREGAVMAQLQPGDRVGMMDDGRIAIDDRNGSSVNRTVDEAQAGAFYQHASSTPIGDAALEQLVDAFNNIDTSQAGPGVQYADAGNGGVASDSGGGTSASKEPAATAEPAQAATQTIANPGTPQDLLAYLDGPGASLSAAQQYALATQLGSLGLGAVDGNTLSLHTLSGGGALLANADGDIVGEVSISSTGAVHLQANKINTDGSSTPVDLHVTGSGQVMTSGQYQEAQFNAAANDAAGGLNLFNSLANLAHFDQLTDLGKLQSLVSLYNQIDGLGSASAALTGTSSTGGNLPGDLGQWGAGLGLISALQGNDPIAQASASASLYNTFVGSSNAIPVPYIQALNLIGAIESGNTVSMIASVVAFIPGWGTALSLAITILAPLFADKPPPPEGATHFEWDDQGNIQIRVDRNQSHGGEIAQNTAASVQSLLQSMVQAINDQTEDTSDNVALNPYLLPKVGFSKEGAWIEISQPDGGAFQEHIQGNNLAQRLFDILSDNGGIAPEWQVQTQLGHMHQLLAQGAGQGEISAELGAGAGGHAHAGNQAYALQGNATEAADYKTQSYGALVVKVQNSEDVQTCQDALAQQLQAQVAITEIYKDVENDGYFESTQWVSATDAQGRLQGLLVVDFDGNGMIETRDVLNLGGNTAEQGNASVEATQANTHADLQRNNVQWLDANGDGVLDAHDPAFAAIKLWVDISQDARLDAGEQQSLASLQIATINFTTGQITYVDGHSTALTAQTLHADTEGVRLTQMQEADDKGTLHTLDAGQMLEHEGYKGQTTVTDADGTRWGKVREASFEHEAKTTGDWEGTAEQDLHRHGGGNVVSRPVQIAATGAKPIAFVPTGQTSAQEALRIVTRDMIQNADSTLFAGMGNTGASLGALAAVGVGLVAAPFVVLAEPLGENQNSNQEALNEAVNVNVNDASTGSSIGVVSATPPAAPAAPAWVAVDAVPRVSGPTVTATLVTSFDARATGLGDASALPSTKEAVPSVHHVSASEAADEITPAALPAVPTNTGCSDLLLALPVVHGETLQGTEDVFLTLTPAMLLANDASTNQLADPSLAVLRISAVGNPVNGHVAMVNGDVVFVPNANFNGTASFSYTVCDQYGLQSIATATLQIAAVNDAPVAHNELVNSDEDAALLFDPSLLLANDTDVDIATNAQVLSIVAVSNAQHGTVTLRNDGQIAFVPEANYFGMASFDYTVSDGNGATRVASTTVQLAAVNDAPVAVDDQFQTYVNSTMTVAYNQLTGNDTDVDGDALTVSAVRDNAHGVVSLVGGQVQFVATPGFIGTATFDYLSDDGNGGQTWATAFVDVRPPPNLYPSMGLVGASFYGTGGNSGYRIDMADASFTPTDDGDTAFATVQLLDISVYRTDFSRPESNPDFGTFYPYMAWQGLAGINGISWSRTGFSLDVQRWAGFFDFHSTWSITDDRGLSNIWHLNYSMSAGAQSYMEHTGYAAPVVLALGAESSSYINTQYSSVRFDINLDGVADTVAWAAPGSGVLGIDLNGDHQITDASEFAFKQYLAGAQTDLEGLKAFDTNYNGALDAGDAQWAKFGVWEDKNSDGKTQEGEYLSLDTLGIANINLQSNGQMHNAGAPTQPGGNETAEVVVMGSAAFTRTDGSTGAVEDALFAYQDGAQSIPNTYANDYMAALNQQALLFNQMVNTASTDGAEPLGFVPVEADQWVPHAQITTAHHDNQLLQTA